jgi:hypothetical protein
MNDVLGESLEALEYINNLLFTHIHLSLRTIRS